MLKKKKCPFCKSFNIITLFQNFHKKDEKIYFECTSHNFQEKKWKPILFKCTSCTLVFSEYTNVNFQNNYKDVVDYEYLNQIKFKKQTFNLFLEKIKKYLNKTCTILEIGSFYGVLGKLLKPHVKEYTGLELSKHACAYSKKNFKLNIKNQSFVSYAKNSKKFDIIILTDVIEHVDYPFRLLTLIEKKLKKNGKLILSTFNFDSLFSRITGNNYPWIIPMHKYYFSTATLKNALNKSNLDIINIQNDTRIISIEYLLNKFSVLFPNFNFIFNFFLKFNFIKRISIKIDLNDLKIYIAKKTSF